MPEAPFTRNDAETYKGETVNKPFLRTLLVLVGFAAFLTPAKAHAQDQIVVKVPFSFIAAGRTFSAGEYRISRLSDTNSSLLLLSGRENRSDVIILRAESEEPSRGQARLDFATVSDQHFLSRIDTANRAYTLSVPSADTLLATGSSKAPIASSASGNN